MNIANFTEFTTNTNQIRNRRARTIELTGKINALNIDFLTAKTLLTLEINEKEAAKQMFDELHEAEKLSIEIKKYRKKRSLDANAYAWVLMDKLAAKTGIPKTEIYRSYIKEIGGNSDTICLINKAVDKVCEGWERNGIGWQTDTMPSKIDGCTNVILYYGSSTYDTEQMKRLIDIIIQDCEEQGIPTATPDEIANMLSLWEEGEKNGKIHNAD